MAIDDDATVRRLDSAREVFRTLVDAHGGRVIDTAGDSVLAVFETAVGAVRAAIEIQGHLSDLTRQAPAGQQLQFRIGIHLGDVIEKPDGSVYGDGVNVAARLQTLTEPGRIVVSQAIQQAVGGRAKADFVDLGEHAVKNIAHPVHAFACVASASTGEVTPIPPVRAAFAPAAATAPFHRRKRVVVAALALAVLVLGSMGWLAWDLARRPAAPAPYSAADRRMTFAVLPFGAPEGDPIAKGLARTFAEAVQASQEARFHWARVTPGAVAGKAVGSEPALRQIGSTLGAHFLLRGTVIPVANGHTVELAVIEADSERVLDTRTLQAQPAESPAVTRREIDRALGGLTYQALKVEVARARQKPDSLLDVRDLVFRAYVDWYSGEADRAAAHAKAQAGLDRALTLAPDDLLALYVTAQMNLCECVRSWALNLGALEQVGMAALDRYLQLRPKSPRMLELRSLVFLKHRRYEESLLVADEVLQVEPDAQTALTARATALLRLGRPAEALAAAQALLAVDDGAAPHALAAAAAFAAQDDAAAARSARKAAIQLTRDEAADPLAGAVVLTLAAAEARAGNAGRASAALKDFHAAVPAVRTVTQLKGWLLPHSPVPDGDAFFEALRQAGLGD